jgi:hypothetical protein
LPSREDDKLRDQLEILERLQEIDSHIQVHEGNLARLPGELQEIARNLVTYRREISEIKEKLAGIEKEIRQRERDLNSEQEKIRVSEKRLLGIKNQKEYNALSRQVKLGKKVAGEIEEALLKFMEEVETLKRSVERKEKEYSGFEEALTAKKAEETQVKEAADEQLTVLKSERKEIAQNLDREYLKKYEIVRKALGNALAEMNNGSCTVCHMAIPAQLTIRVLKQEEIISCPSCQRILFVRPENVPQFNKMEA